MIRRSTVVVTAIWMLLALAAGGAMFLLKYQVQAQEERLAALNRAIVKDMQAVHVLKAEWSFLNQPARLEDLGRRHLDLDVAAPARIVTLSELPFRAAPDADAPGGAPESPPAADQVSPRLATYTAR